MVVQGQLCEPTVCFRDLYDKESKSGKKNCLGVGGCGGLGEG